MGNSIIINYVNISLSLCSFSEFLLGLDVTPYSCFKAIPVNKVLGCIMLGGVCYRCYDMGPFIKRLF